MTGPIPDDYVPVSERLEKFRADHPEWSLIVTLSFDGDAILGRAEVADEAGRVIAVGHAEEVRDRGFVNKTSAVENCETSAWGRALANLGYEVKRGVASREEIEKVSRARVRPQQKTSGKEASQDNEPGPGDTGAVLKPWQAIAAVAKRFGLTDETRRQVMVAVAGKEHSKDLSTEEVVEVMRQIRWLADGFVRLEVVDGKPVLVDTTPENPGPANPGQRIDG